MAYKNHKNLVVWQKSMILAKQIYDVTRKFPREELFGLVSQMQRAAVSIPSNIAEGNGRDSNQELDRFLKIATGSACELDTQVELAAMNEYITFEEKNRLQLSIEEVLKLIYAFRKSINHPANLNAKC